VELFLHLNLAKLLRFLPTPLTCFIDKLRFASCILIWT